MAGWVNNLIKGKAELINQPFPLRLKTSEKEWLFEQAEKECSNVNSIIRKAVNQYRNNIKPISK